MGELTFPCPHHDREAMDFTLVREESESKAFQVALQSLLFLPKKNAIR